MKGGGGQGGGEHKKKKGREGGADAVVNLRFSTSAVMQGAAEVTAYGTAVKFVWARSQRQAGACDLL